MRKRFLSVWVSVLLAVLLTACGAPAQQTADEVTEEPVPAETPEVEAGGEDDPPQDVLPGLDAAAFECTMPETDYAAFAAYIPVLKGEQTFCWVAGPYDGYPDYDWEPFDTDMAGFHDRLWSMADTDCPPETLTLDRLAVQDVDGDGGGELVLLFQDLAYRYLVLHMEGEDCYGTTFGVRWLVSLRENGIYEGSGGAGSSTYYRMAFRDGVFQQQELGSREEWATGSAYTLDGETVSRETFDAWRAEHLVDEVTWYAADGSVIPENP